MSVTVPANTSARVYIPASSENKVTENGIALSSSEGIKILGNKDGYVELEVGSGNYSFVIQK